MDLLKLEEGEKKSIRIIGVGENWGRGEREKI